MAITKRLLVLFALVSLLLATLSCASDAPALTAPAPPSPTLLHAEPWPEADALFRSNPIWLGADGAYSVDLGDGRVLWLFADTFVSSSFPNSRRLATMVRNSVGIQSGYDPSTASMAFYWGGSKRKPASFFPEEGEAWFWPGHGTALGGKLFIFLMATRPSSEGLGFEHFDWRVVSIENPEQPPPDWDLKWLETPHNPFGLIVSGSIIQVHDYVYAFAVQEPSHDIHVVRWLLTKFVVGDLTAPQWWAGPEQGWLRQQDLVKEPQALFSGGQTEFTVHFEPALERYLEVQTVGFGAADLGFRLAESATGPWRALERFYRPEEYGVPGILIYAAKAHPHLEGADLVLTYATNIVPFHRLVARGDLYYPRFLRATLSTSGQE